MGIIIRAIEQKDAPVLAELIKTVFREFKIHKPGTVYTDSTTNDLFSLFKIPGAAYWVAEKDGKLLGGCGIYPTDGLREHYAELVKFYLLAASIDEATLQAKLSYNTFYQIVILEIITRKAWIVIVVKIGASW